MIIKEIQKDVTVIGEHTSKQAGISAKKMAKLQYLLTKGLYKDPITAVIAEWTNNGVDSVVQAGKVPQDNPVVVTIGTKANGQKFFRVEDKGTGLDKTDFETICMEYLESTKEDDNDSIGHFGIGMKSFLSLERGATFTCRKNGKEVVYFVYEGAEFVNYDVISEKDTTEENGVIAELTIKDNAEYFLFTNKAKQKLSYYDTVILMINDYPINFSIYRTDLFQYSSLNSTTEIHLCLKDVYYSLDWEALGMNRIMLPIALRFGLDSGITPTPSRESYITNETTKDMIIKRLKDVADWMVKKYNSLQYPYETLLDAFPHIDSTSHVLNIEATSFPINPIERLSDIPIKELEVKGIKINTPSYYKGRLNLMASEYECVAYKDSFRLKTKRIYRYISNQLVGKRKVVVVGDNFKGNVRTYVVNNYPAGTMFVKFIGKRTLGKTKGIFDENTYRSCMALSMYPKYEWRERIKEFNLVASTLISNFIDETKVEETQVYTDWLVAKKAAIAAKIKANRVSGGNYSGLNKQVGDVTLGYNYKAKLGFPFKKEAFPIKDLASNHFLTVYFTDVTEEIKAVIEGMRVQDNIKFALVGKKEVTKIPDCKQFVKYQTFMRDYKPFKRLASAIIFKHTVEEFDKIAGQKNKIFQTCIKDVISWRNQLDDYSRRNSSSINGTVEQMIIDVADGEDLYDKELWDVYTNLKKAIKKYDFVTCLKEPNYWDAEGVKKYNRVIAQMLLFRKKYYNDLPEAVDIVLVDKPTQSTQGKGEDELGELEEELETA